jgi:DNA modification methylase
LVEVFREVRRVLRKDGTLWLNIGDSYASGTKGSGGDGSKKTCHGSTAHQLFSPIKITHNCKPKDLLMIPAQLALALRADGWWLRSEIVWAKKAPMPESCTDRPTCAHEKVFLLTKSARYFYDAEAVKEESAPRTAANYALGLKFGKGQFIGSPTDKRLPRDIAPDEFDAAAGRNMRNVWHLGPSPFPEAHFATYPPEIPRRAILAGTSAKGVCPKCGGPWVRVVETERVKHSGTPGVFGRHNVPGRETSTSSCFRTQLVPVSQTIGWRPSCSCDVPYSAVTGVWPAAATVLDPFLGSGTTALVADQLGRDCIGIELSLQYAAMAERRLRDDAGMFASIAAE